MKILFFFQVLLIPILIIAQNSRVDEKNGFYGLKLETSLHDFLKNHEIENDTYSLHYHELQKQITDLNNKINKSKSSNTIDLLAGSNLTIAKTDALHLESKMSQLKNYKKRPSIKGEKTYFLYAQRNDKHEYFHEYDFKSGDCYIDFITVSFYNEKLYRIDAYYYDQKESKCLLNTIRELFGKEDGIELDNKSLFWSGKKTKFIHNDPSEYYSTFSAISLKISTEAQPTEKDKQTRFNEF